MRALMSVVIAATLAGCAGLALGPSTPSGTTFIRSDGRPVSKEQLDADQSSCSSDGQKSYQCMVGKGYFLVAVRDAEAKQEQFARTAEEARQREQTRLAEQARKQEELERAARRQAKNKKKPPDRAVN